MKLRIFCALRHASDPNQYYGGLWTSNFYPALQDLGNEIIESQTDLLPTSRFMEVPGNFTQEELELRAKTTEQILAEVRAAHDRQPLDLFLSYFYNAHFDSAGFDELRRLGIPSVNFYCNSMDQFELVKEVAAKADFAWHVEKNARQLYLEGGANPVWVQMGADPQVYHPIAGIRRLPKACFVGQRYADRDRWIAFLIRAGVPVEIYGHGWGGSAYSDEGIPSKKAESTSTSLGRLRTVPGSWQSYFEVVRKNIGAQGLPSGLLRSIRQVRYRRQSRIFSSFISPNARGLAAEIPAVLARHEVCLNFSNVWSDGRPGSSLIPHVRLRDFEAPMCRTCYLTGYSAEITEFYDGGREIVTYRSPEELADKAQFYRQHSEAAEKLREAGYRRALQDHTWKRRFEELFQKVGLRNGC